MEPQAPPSRADHKFSPKNTVNGAFGKLAPLLEAEGLAAAIPDLKASVQRMNQGIFRLVVMGEIKKGKSSFINALLSEPGLLPTDVDVATSTVYKILYGSEKAFGVYFLEDVDTGHRPEMKVIPESELVLYGTEKGNPNNEKRVDFIAACCPSPLLKGGLAIIDTPGVGGLYKAHRDITWRYAPNADAIFFILDSVEAVISADEIKFLKELTSKVTKRVFFVQTKIDAADEETCKVWELRNKDLLKSELGIPERSLVYFPVSSEMKLEADRDRSGEDLIDSGFHPLLNFLHHDLLERKDEELASDAARDMYLGAARIKNVLDERGCIFREQAEEQRKQVKEEFAQTKKDLDEWARTVLPKELKTYSTSFEEIRRKFRNRLSNELDPSGPLITNKMEEIKDLDLSSDILMEHASEAGKDVLVSAAEQSAVLTKEFGSEFQKLAIATLQNLDLDSAFSTPAATMQEEAVSSEKTIDLEESSTGVDKIMQTHGPGAMLLMGAAVLGAGWPVVVGAAVVGWSFGFENVENKERKALLKQLEQKLREALGGASRNAIQEFDELATKAHNEFISELDQAKTRRQEELTTRLEELTQSSKLSREEAASKMKEIKDRTAEADAILNALQPLWKNSNKAA